MKISCSFSLVGIWAAGGSRRGMDGDKLVIHMAKMWIRRERGGKVARIQKREEEEGFWLYEVNTDRGITEDKDL